MLRLQGIGKSEIYEMVTRTHLRLGDTDVENETHTVFKKTLLDQSAESDLIRIELLSFEQTAEDGASKFIEHLHELNKQLIFECDILGNIQRIVNYDDLPNRWKRVQDNLYASFGNSPELGAFVAAFSQSLELGESALVESMRHKGIYGVLFSGMNGFDPSPNEFERNRIIPNFIADIPLPLTIDAEVFVILNNHVAYWYIAADGTLNESAFNYDVFKRLMKDVTNTFNLEPIPEVIVEEKYLFRQSDGWLSEAKQYLSFEVPNVYWNEIGYSLILQTPKK